MRFSADTANNWSFIFFLLKFLGSLLCVFLADPSKLFVIFSIVFLSIPESFDCSSLSGPQNHSFHEHEGVQNELIVDCIVSYIQCQCGVGVVSVKMHHILLESLENIGSPMLVSVVVHEGLVFSLTVQVGQVFSSGKLLPY